MSEAFLCSKESECPVVMSALDRAVKAEAVSRVTEANLSTVRDEYAKNRGVMNELFSAGVAMRKAQVEYFKNRDADLLKKSKVSEARFDRAIQACRDLGKPVQATML